MSCWVLVINKCKNFIFQEFRVYHNICRFIENKSKLLVLFGTRKYNFSIKLLCLYINYIARGHQTKKYWRLWSKTQNSRKIKIYLQASLYIKYLRLVTIIIMTIIISHLKFIKTLFENYTMVWFSNKVLNI